MKKILLCLAFILAFAVACIARTIPDADAPTANDAIEVTYKVFGEGTSSASLTYTNETGNTEQVDTDLPWQLRFTAESGQFLAVSAQNSEDGGTIKCQILIDGELKETAESTGAYVIAACNGSVE